MGLCYCWSNCLGSWHSYGFLLVEVNFTESYYLGFPLPLQTMGFFPPGIEDASRKMSHSFLKQKKTEFYDVLNFSESGSVSVFLQKKTVFLTRIIPRAIFRYPAKRIVWVCIRFAYIHIDWIIYAQGAGFVFFFTLSFKEIEYSSIFTMKRDQHW